MIDIFNEWYYDWKRKRVLKYLDDIFKKYGAKYHILSSDGRVIRCVVDKYDEYMLNEIAELCHRFNIRLSMFIGGEDE